MVYFFDFNSNEGCIRNPHQCHSGKNNHQGMIDGATVDAYRFYWLAPERWRQDRGTRQERTARKRKTEADHQPNLYELRWQQLPDTVRQLRTSFPQPEATSTAPPTRQHLRDSQSRHLRLPETFFGN